MLNIFDRFFPTLESEALEGLIENSPLPLLTFVGTDVLHFWSSSLALVKMYQDWSWWRVILPRFF